MTHEEFLTQFPPLIQDYKPSPSVLSHIGNVKLLMVIGPSGAGKTTIMNFLGLQYVPSDITRTMRPDEHEGIDYHFRSDYDKIIEQIKAGEFVQTAIGPGGDFYSTLASSYPQNGTAVMAIVSDVIPIFRQLGFAGTTSVFITPPNYDEWLRRMGSHHMEGEQLAKRLSEAKRSFSFALNDKETHFILNDKVGSAIAQLKSLTGGEVDQIRENSARQASEIIYQKLS